MSGTLGFERFKDDDEARSDRESTAAAAPKSYSAVVVGGSGGGGAGVAAVFHNIDLDADMMTEHLSTPTARASLNRHK